MPQVILRRFSYWTVLHRVRRFGELTHLHALMAGNKLGRMSWGERDAGDDVTACQRSPLPVPRATQPVPRFCVVVIDDVVPRFRGHCCESKRFIKDRTHHLRQNRHRVVGMKADALSRQHTVWIDASRKNWHTMFCSLQERIGKTFAFGGI